MPEEEEEEEEEEKSFIDQTCRRHSNSMSGGAGRTIALRNDKLIPLPP